MNEVYDLVFIGGGPSATLTSISILRERPQTRICIIESTEVFTKKLGESTADLTAIFLNRFDIHDILKKQVKKTGLKFVFENADQFLSPSYKSIANGYQLDRSLFDQDLLDEVMALGAIVLRPYRYQSHQMENEHFVINCCSKNAVIKIQSKWLIDCSGRRAVIAREKNWLKNIGSLGTACTWCHVKSSQLNYQTENWDEKAIGDSSQATTHFIGKDYWAWFFPVNATEHSFGITYLKATYEQGPREVFQSILNSDERFERIFSQLNIEDIQLRFVDNIDFEVKTIKENRLLLLGDSCGFSDALFSPGLELVAQQSLWVSSLLKNELNGMDCRQAWLRYERKLLLAIKSRIHTYRKRYHLMQNPQAFSTWLRMDFFAYYLFHVLPAAYFPKALRNFVFIRPVLMPVYNLMTSIYLSSKIRSLRSIQFSRLRVPAIWQAPLYVIIWFGVWVRSFFRMFY